jgi:predicted aspartyl protease
MTSQHDRSRSRNWRQFRARLRHWPLRGPLLLNVPVIVWLTLFFSVFNGAYGASGPAPSTHTVEVMVFTAADEFSPVVETIRDGESLSPLGEMSGPGGSKWFMVKTKNGNLGWIKAADNIAARKIDVHFRSLPNEITAIGPGSPAMAASSKASVNGAITIPVKMLGGHAIVPVTFNNSVTGNLMVDTGAGRTMVSKRIATNLRLHSTGSGTGYGVGGQVTVGIARVESVRVGDVEIQNMSVSIYDFSPDPRYEGLLGIDFLGRFHMSLDSAKQVMVLTPR